MIYNFNLENIPKLSQVGGKAKALIESTKKGFPVPEGIVLSVDFFQTWLRKIKKDRAIKLLYPFLFFFFEFALRVNLVHFCKTKGSAKT